MHLLLLTEVQGSSHVRYQNGCAHGRGRTGARNTVLPALASGRKRTFLWDSSSCSAIGTRTKATNVILISCGSRTRVQTGLHRGAWQHTPRTAPTNQPCCQQAPTFEHPQQTARDLESMIHRTFIRDFEQRRYFHDESHPMST